MSGNSENHPKMSSTNVLFCARPRDIQFNVIKEERNQKNILILKAAIRELWLFLSLISSFWFYDYANMDSAIIKNGWNSTDDWTKDWT